MSSPDPPNSERYPIGPPDLNAPAADTGAYLEAIQRFPAEFAAALQGLTRAQLDTPYREGGWTLRQLAHHVADSHMNAWVRMKLALTEDWPTIKPYDERRWAETAEVQDPVDLPLALLVPLHAKMVALLASLSPEEWERGYVHPENGRVALRQVAALYSWHGRHHLAHATGLREHMGW